ncbi:TPA: hypothetical protein ACSP0D_004035, partial [Aeromonas veronii]
MAFTLQTYLAPLPNIVIQNYRNQIEPYCWKNKRVIFAPHCELIFNLVYRGFFIGFEILGALDKSISKQGDFGNGLKVFSYEELDHVKPDIVIIANTRYHLDIISELTSVQR